MKLFLCILAIFCAITMAMAIPTPNHIMLKDGHRLTFDGEACSKMLKSVALHHMMNFVDPDNLPNIPQSPYHDETQPVYSIADQFDGMLKWVNLTDLVVNPEDFQMDSCVVHHDTHGVRFEAKNVRVKATADFKYEVDEKMSIISNDHGKVELTAQGDIDALIFAHPQEHHSEEHSSEEKEEEHPQTPDHYDAHVFTFINDMKITFSESPYAEFYNQLVSEHVEELKWLVSLAANEWAGDVLDDYLNPLENDVQFQHEHHLDHQPQPGVVGGGRFIDLGMILNAARPTRVESPEEVKQSQPTAQPTHS